MAKINFKMYKPTEKNGRLRSAMITTDIVHMQSLPDLLELDNVPDKFKGRYSRLNTDGKPYISQDGKAVCYFKLPDVIETTVEVA